MTDRPGGKSHAASGLIRAAPLDGKYELGDKDCIWTRAHERLKYHGEPARMLDGEPIYVNSRLEGTSAWANTFLGRDHSAKE